MQETEKLLVLLAGQSNMAGRGYATPEDFRPLPRVEYIRPDFQWAPAIEPITKDRPFVGTFSEKGEKITSTDPFETVMPGDGQKVVGVGLGRTFGKLLAADNPDRTVGLIPTAVGGTSISAWMPGGVDDWDKTNHPYDVAIAKAKEAQKSGKIIAILWHQGENDAGNQTPDYKQKLKTVVENFRKDLGDDSIPFFAGYLASFYNPQLSEHVHIIDDAIMELTGEIPGFYAVETKDLDHRGDNLHFDTASLYKLGERYYSAFKNQHFPTQYR